MGNTQVNAELNSYWDNRFKRTAVKLLPGDFFACSGEQVIVTVLGSCIAVCLYETQLKIGGMNHFMLPQLNNDGLVTADEKSSEQTRSEQDTDKKFLADYQHSNAARYGNAAMELLINEIIKLGGSRKNLTAKIFGGSAIIGAKIDVGQKNINFIHDYLAIENIASLSQDLGGSYARKVYFIPATNEVYVKTINNMHNNTIESRENNYQETLANKSNENIFYL
jgi:chemotaxis protein CheD